MENQTKCMMLAKKMRKESIYMTRIQELVKESIEISRRGKFVDVILPPEKKSAH